MPSLLPLLTAVLVAGQLVPAQADSVPKFADYPARVFTGKPARPRLHNQHLRDVREQFQYAITDGKIGAAGHYYVVKLPCGSACVAPVLLDARSGRITELFTVSGWREVDDDFDAVVSRDNSRLIVFRGARNETGINGNHYYLLGENGRLTHLHTMNTDGNFETSAKIE
jgi:hypothetical protein